MQNRAAKHRWFHCSSSLLSVAIILSSLSLCSCAAFDRNQPQIQGALATTTSVAGTVAVTPFFGPNIEALAALIAAIAGSLLTVDKFIEKLRHPASAGTAEDSTTSTTPKA